MPGIPVLRRLLAIQDSAGGQEAARRFPPLELRFALEYPNEPSRVSPHDRSRDGVVAQDEESDVVGVHQTVRLLGGRVVRDPHGIYARLPIHFSIR